MSITKILFFSFLKNIKEVTGVILEHFLWKQIEMLKVAW
jgi:hypothetical protein